ncbi:hypothetical protein [Wolbachia endosymbiont (group A) of Brachyopa scutellaris]|uniref:hypothetical protein n=1 Tax=Wolbachia endosymbiont (group A) of Brachyopa scutellaris TaxID=3066140 RepID=UPI0031335512
MSEEGFFSKYIIQPMKNFYNKCASFWRKDASDDVAGDAHNIVQESSESLDTHVQSNENDII